MGMEKKVYTKIGAVHVQNANNGLLISSSVCVCASHVLLLWTSRWKSHHRPRPDIYVHQTQETTKNKGRHEKEEKSEWLNILRQFSENCFISQFTLTQIYMIMLTNGFFPPPWSWSFIRSVFFVLILHFK